LKWIYTMHNQHDDDNDQWFFHQPSTKWLKRTYVHRCVILRNKPCYKSISTGAQHVTPDSKIHCKNVKICWFSSGNWFLCTLPWLLKGATQWCTSKKECNKLDLSAPQFFWLVDHNDWSRWLLVVPIYMQFYFQFYWWGWQIKTVKLRYLFLLSRVTYRALVEML
jgi:hypothetical protein